MVSMKFLCKVAKNHVYFFPLLHTVLCTHVPGEQMLLCSNLSVAASANETTKGGAGISSELRRITSMAMRIKDRLTRQLLLGAVTLTRPGTHGPKDPFSSSQIWLLG